MENTLLLGVGDIYQYILRIYRVDMDPKLYKSIVDFKVNKVYPEPEEGQPPLTKQARWNIWKRDESFVLEGMYAVKLSISIRFLCFRIFAITSRLTFIWTRWCAEILMQTAKK